MTAAADETGGWSVDQRRHEHLLLDEFHRLAETDPRRLEVRDELIQLNLPLVHHLARRYRDRGESMEDLVQVGTVGLIKAIDGFDVSRGLELSTYATPTILGEIKRHFRDRTWAVRVPRRLQELQSQVTATTEELTAELHRSPTVRELAERLDVSQADVLDALEARQAYSTDSIEADRDDDSSPGIVATLGDEDGAFEAIDERETLRPLIEALPERERRILMLRFFEDKSQSEIAEEVGISQMHVSRLLARTLATLRAGMTAD